ncbi:hypothetical protein [Kosakonia radicincitans]|uniref:hypothetical protein n=1 Tax=Kosakonia radicincitans TaxID=283686 RepID=UPI0005C2BA5F|nr:hypothetical protein [Kosakonia radicincitans]KIS43389.1 hypothetical protein LG58_1210 [Kosakonia radicincitans YD4]
MAKLQDCQFIEIKIDNKPVKGASTESAYKDWIEGYAPMGITAYSGPDGTYFDSTHVSLLVTKESSTFFEQYLKRGYKNITITAVHRGSDEYSANYEIQRITYTDCKIQSLRYEMRDKLFMDINFTFEGEVDLTINVPNAQESGLDKIGPIKYDIPTKALK